MAPGDRVTNHGDKHMTIELLNLRNGKITLCDTVRGALEMAERRAIHSYRIVELLRSGPVLKLQIGSSSS